MRLAAVFALVATAAAAQTLDREISLIAAEAQGRVSVACLLPGSSLTCDLNPTAHPPMQSVFKLPLGLAVLHQIEQGKLALDQTERFLPADRILPHVYSPLQTAHPKGGSAVTIRELLRLTITRSDNVAADILLRILSRPNIGGPEVVDSYIASLPVPGFHLEDDEAELHRHVLAQYRNWFEPAGAVRLLCKIADGSLLTPEHTKLLLGWMQSSMRNTRLGGDLPPGTAVAHKSGTSDVDNGLAHATNDIGLISLPEGRQLAIAVFVTDSTANEATREKVIARIARCAYDASLNTAASTTKKTSLARQP